MGTAPRDYARMVLRTAPEIKDHCEDKGRANCICRLATGIAAASAEVASGTTQAWVKKELARSRSHAGIAEHVFPGSVTVEQRHPARPAWKDAPASRLKVVTFVLHKRTQLAYPFLAADAGVAGPLVFVRSRAAAGPRIYGHRSPTSSPSGRGVGRLLLSQQEGAMSVSRRRVLKGAGGGLAGILARPSRRTFRPEYRQGGGERHHQGRHSALALRHDRHHRELRCTTPSC